VRSLRGGGLTGVNEAASAPTYTGDRCSREGQAGHCRDRVIITLRAAAGVWP
jgi:hypothetical protein